MSPPSHPSGPLYLSRLAFDPRTRFMGEHLKNPRLMYAKLLEAFADSELLHHSPGGSEENGRQSGGMLFRVEPEPDRHSRGMVVLVQSAAQPDWSRLDGRLFALAPEPAKAFQVNVPVGATLRFRLRACPVRSKPAMPRSPDGARERGKRQPVFAPILTEAATAQKSRVASDAETRAKTLRVEQACAKWLADVLKRRGGAEIVSHQEDRWDSFAFGDDLPPIYDMQIARERPIVLNDYGSQFHRGKGDLHPVLFEGKLTVTDPHQLALLLRQGVGPGKAFGCGLLSLARA